MRTPQRHYKHVSSLLAATLLATVALGACKSKDQYASATDTTMNRLDSAAGVADTSALKPTPAPESSGWTDQSVLGFATAANSGEVELGKLGQTKATSPAVKAFAKQMVTDHRAMLTDVKSMTAKLNATADTVADPAHDLMNRSRDELKDLSEKEAGADWDKNFMDKMIDDHQKVLDKLQDASKNTANTDLRAALEKATGKVQQHLTKAQDIKSHLK